MMGAVLELRVSVGADSQVGLELGQPGQPRKRF